MSGHVVILGYGAGGRLIARALQDIGVTFVALDLNGQTVQQAAAAGEPLVYADVTAPDALEAAGVADAAAVVAVLSDPDATERAVRSIRTVSATVPIVARTRYRLEAERSARAGATVAVAEEIEASFEVVAQLLARLEIPGNIAEVLLGTYRQATYAVPARGARAAAVPFDSLPAELTAAPVTLFRLPRWRLERRAHAWRHRPASGHGRDDSRDSGATGARSHHQPQTWSSRQRTISTSWATRRTCASPRPASSGALSTRPPTVRNSPFVLRVSPGEDLTAQRQLTRVITGRSGAREDHPAFHTRPITLYSRDRSQGVRGERPLHSHTPKHSHAGGHEHRAPSLQPGPLAWSLCFSRGGQHVHYCDASAPRPRSGHRVHRGCHAAPRTDGRIDDRRPRASRREGDEPGRRSWAHRRRTRPG